jgi:uncharacterized membrane protein YhaH (DUF805 family)
MRGRVLGFDSTTGRGAIGGDDGNRYDFALAAWFGTSPPRYGDLVEFQPQGQDAIRIEREDVKSSFDKFYFSYQGRISRSQFWLKWMLPFLATGLFLTLIVSAAALQSMAKSADPVTAFLNVFVPYAVIFTIATIWTESVILAKRIHDRNKPGWLVFLCLAPRFAMALLPDVLPFVVGTINLIISMWFLIEFGCLRGTAGANRYGPDPVG